MHIYIYMYNILCVGLDGVKGSDRISKLVLMRVLVGFRD